MNLNEWSARVVMGWVLTPLPDHPGIYLTKEPGTSPGYTPETWHPDTDLNQCFMVLEKLREKYDISIYCHRKDGLDDGFSVRIIGKETHLQIWDMHLPEAILIAARQELGEGE